MSDATAGVLEGTFLVLLAVLFYHFCRWVGMPEPDAIVASVVIWAGAGRAR